MSFDPTTTRRWTLSLEWRRYTRKVDTEVTPAHFDWLEFMIDGEPLSALLAGSTGTDENGDAAKHGAAGITALQPYPGNSFKETWTPAHVEMLLSGTAQHGICYGVAPLKSGRVPLYVCPECGKHACGTTAVRIERVDEKTIVWHQFLNESDLLVERDGDWVDAVISNEQAWENLGPFFFNLEQYITCLKNFPAKPAKITAD